MASIYTSSSSSLISHKVSIGNCSYLNQKKEKLILFSNGSVILLITVLSAKGN